MILDILKDGLEYSKTNSSRIILFYLGILIFPLILIESYSYHIIENCLNGMINNNDKLPDIKINKESFINGLKLLVMKITYYLPEIILLTIAPYFNVNYILFTIVMVILTILSYYISEIACICMVESGSFKEGYNFSTISEILKSVGITYVELIITTFIILLGIFALLILFTGIITILSQVSTTLFMILSVLMFIFYFVLMIVIIPLYVLFKNRTMVSIYNLR